MATNGGGARRNRDVADLRTFKDANKYATNEANGRLYVVWSYRKTWPMFIFDRKIGVWFENEDKYSVTTSKHRSQCVPFGITTDKLCCAEMLRYIERVEDAEALTDVPIYRIDSEANVVVE